MSEKKIRPLGKNPGFHIAERSDRDDGGMQYEVIDYIGGWQMYIEGDEKTQAEVQDFCNKLNAAYYPGEKS